MIGVTSSANELCEIKILWSRIKTSSRLAHLSVSLQPLVPLPALFLERELFRFAEVLLHHRVHLRAWY